MVQYKIVHRILATNQNLLKWEIRTNESCDFCKETDTIEHFIYECPKINPLWSSIFNWIKSVLHIDIQLSKYEILFGIPNERDDIMINNYNFIILYTKYYIYNYNPYVK